MIALLLAAALGRAAPPPGAAPASPPAPAPPPLAAPAPPPVAPLAPFAPPAPTEHLLPSGIPVWILAVPDTPLVRVTVSLRRGALHAVDPLPLVHAGAVLDESPAGAEPPAWRDALAEAGAELELGVGMARAWASVEVPAGQEERGLALLDRALSEPALPRRALRTNRAAAVRDARRAGAVPGALHAIAVQRALYPPEHPLGRVWTAAEQRRVRPRHARRAWTEELRRGSPAVVVVGAVTAESILPLLERHLGDLPAAGAPPAPLPALPPPAPGPRTLVVDLPGLERVFVSVLLSVPGAFDPAEAEVELLHRALAAEFDSRLSRLLRVERGWTYAVDGLLRVWPGHGVLEVRFAVDPADLPAVVPAVQAELRRLVEEPPAGAELATARLAVRRDAALRQLRIARQAHQLAVLQAWGQGPAHDAALLARTQALTDAGVAGRAPSLLDPAQAVWVFTGDRQRVEQALEAAALPVDAVRGAQAIVDGAPPVPL